MTGCQLLYLTRRRPVVTFIPHFTWLSRHTVQFCASWPRRVETLRSVLQSWIVRFNCSKRSMFKDKMPLQYWGSKRLRSVVFIMDAVMIANETRSFAKKKYEKLHRCQTLLFKAILTLRALNLLRVTQTERSISHNVPLQQVFREVETSFGGCYFSPGLLQLWHQSSIHCFGLLS